MSRLLSFDIGHSSIGWAALKKTANLHPSILASGVVTFPADDCLVSKRRDLRRTRRNIRSTRQRIERLKRWLEHQQVLTRVELDQPGHAAPFLLAAAALTGVRQLSALELWHCLRWYAHNRGYDGNSRWSRQEEDSEDTEKVKNAKKQLNELETKTMAETVCKLLKLKPEEVDKKISSFLPYKTLNTAYPRKIITAEVARLLQLHCDKLPGLNNLTCSLIFPDRDLTSEEHATLKQAEIKLPKRYHGGLLFGQLVPRFDNRIISRCPITWANIYRAEIKKGTSEKEALRLAERDAKVPTKKSIEFREYRLARILANLKADGAPISTQARQAIFTLAKNKGRLTHKDLDQVIDQHQPKAKTNVHNYFLIHPDSEDALVFDPVMHELHKAKNTGKTLKPFWKFLPESADAAAVNLWRNNEPVSLHWIAQQVKGTEHEADLESTIEKHFKKAKKSFADLEDFCLGTKASASWPTGRAPYARPVLRQVTEEVLAGHDPTKACRETNPQKGEDKSQDGVLYENSVPNSEINQLLQKRPLDKLTNNALVRHRLLILDRLLEELISEFAPDDKTQITDITVEVTREVKELSGKSAKEISSELNNRLKDFKSAVKHLEKHAPKLPVNGSLIRKCRIAMDLDWTCIFTNKKFDAYDLPKLELEHIIPFSKRKTNALHALVLTWPKINRWKGNQTALDFIKKEGGNQVPGMENLSIRAFKNYETAVKRLAPEKVGSKDKFKSSKKFPHFDDKCRCVARRNALLVDSYEAKEQGFTEGALTQTSHLIKLAMRGIKIKFREQGLPEPTLHSIPGIATSEVRKSWDLISCLGHPDLCGNDAMRWQEKRDRLTGSLITEDHQKFPALSSPDPSDKKAIKAAEKCPNDACEQPLSWPEDLSISEAHCPHCHAILKRIPKPKDDIRSLTHLHHALDALTIGLITHYFPLTTEGQNQSGLLWKALVSRNRTPKEAELLRRTQLFREHTDKKTGKPRFHLNKLDPSITEQVTRHLALGRVVQHVPANRSGTKAETMTWGVTHIEGEGDDARVSLRQNTSVVEDGKRNRTPKSREERAGKLLGPQPKSGKGKLKTIKGALIVEKNFGIALDPQPQVIPFHQVTQRLEELKKANGGKIPRILRNGMQIKIGDDPKPWQIRSIQNSKRDGVLLDLSRSAMIPYRTPGKNWCKGTKLTSILKQGFSVLGDALSGHRM